MAIIATGWIATGWAVQAQAASVTVGTLVDTDDGMAWRASGTVAPRHDWLIGAGAGRHEMRFNGENYSGTSLAASTRASFGSFFAGAGGQHWKDSGELESVALHAELGWMSQGGLSLSALFTDRSLRAPFTTTGLDGQLLTHESRSDGQGFGAAVAWTGNGWNVGARFLHYSYRHRYTGEIAPLVSVPGLLDELDSIGGDLANISPVTTPVLQVLEDAGLLGPVQGLLATVGNTAGAVIPPVVELTDGVIEGLPLPLPTVGELLNLGLFPRMQQLVASPVTLVAGAPDREFALTVERQLSRTSLRADLGLQRDALTREEIRVASVTFGYRFTDRIGLDTTIGMADGGALGEVGYGGLSLTWRGAP
jgi:hypothetical protein